MNARYEDMVGGFQKIERSTPRRSEQEQNRNRKESRDRDNGGKRQTQKN
jgi:hypothetical protein